MRSYYDKINIATMIPREHPAYLELAFMENRAGFLRKLLEDAYKVHPSFEGYTSMPEEERMKTYFGVGQSEAEQRKEMLDGLAHMTADKTMRRKLALEAAYMSLWQDYKSTYCGKDVNDFVLAQYFVSHYAGVKEKGLPPGDVKSPDARRSFHDALMDFVRSFPPDGQSHRDEWEDYAKSMPGAEKLYIRLCEDWAAIHDNQIDTDGTLPENAAGYITGFMQRFLEHDAPMDHNIHTAFFKDVAEYNFSMVLKAGAGTAQRKAG